jgi:hypothetical protein
MRGGGSGKTCQAEATVCEIDCGIGRGLGEQSLSTLWRDSSRKVYISHVKDQLTLYAIPYGEG